MHSNDRTSLTHFQPPPPLSQRMVSSLTVAWLSINCWEPFVLNSQSICCAELSHVQQCSDIFYVVSKICNSSLCKRGMFKTGLQITITFSKVVSRNEFSLMTFGLISVQLYRKCNKENVASWQKNAIGYSTSKNRCMIQYNDVLYVGIWLTHSCINCCIGFVFSILSHIWPHYIYSKVLIEIWTIQSHPV